MEEKQTLRESKPSQGKKDAAIVPGNNFPRAAKIFQIQRELQAADLEVGKLSLLGRRQGKMDAGIRVERQKIRTRTIQTPSIPQLG